MTLDKQSLIKFCAECGVGRRNFDAYLWWVGVEVTRVDVHCSDGLSEVVVYVKSHDILREPYQWNMGWCCLPHG